MSAPASAEDGTAAGEDYAGVTPLTGVAVLADRFDGFILDQWGVLHDGTRPYAGALECLQKLRARGKRIVVLSNSGRREDYNIELMRKMGFACALFDRLICAGEDARQALAARSDDFHRALGRRCFAFTRDGDRSVLEGIGLEFSARVEQADFLAVLGTDSPRRSLADYESELQAGIAAALPMVCANPDLWRFAPDGMIEAAGVLARRYEALGGRVYYHGKPHPAIYASCLAALGCPSRRVIAIGDSLEHDILGARRVGLASALVTGGVHAETLGIVWGELPSANHFSALIASAPAVPHFLLPAFIW
jgi:HAD superfamily hydrolase (TIGR01459 family)